MVHVKFLAHCLEHNNCSTMAPWGLLFSIKLIQWVESQISAERKKIPLSLFFLK